MTIKEADKYISKLMRNDPELVEALSVLLKELGYSPPESEEDLEEDMGPDWCYCDHCAAGVSEEYGHWWPGD